MPAPRMRVSDSKISLTRWALAGSLLGFTVHRAFLALPIAVTGFLLQHAIQGWCPPVPLLRRMGFRTPREIGSPQGPTARVDGREVVVLCSNDYLGHAAHPDLATAQRDSLAVVHELGVVRVVHLWTVQRDRCNATCIELPQYRLIVHVSVP